MIDAQIVSATAPVPGLMQSAHGDLRTLRQSSAPFAVTLMEYAARVCYHSTTKLGHAPGFVAARLREGHADIVEHAHITLVFYAETPYTPGRTGGRTGPESGEVSALSGLDHSLDHSLDRLACAARGWNPYLAVTHLTDGAAARLVVSGNARAWLDALDAGAPGLPVQAVRAACARVAPDVFAPDVVSAYEAPWLGAPGG